MLALAMPIERTISRILATMWFRLLLALFAFSLTSCGDTEDQAKSHLDSTHNRAASPYVGRDGESVRQQLVSNKLDVEYRVQLKVDYRVRLESAPTFQLLALHPEDQEDGEFHGYVVLGKTLIGDAAERRELVEALYAGINANEGLLAACFIPRHGIRLSGDGAITDFVICFECLQVQIHHTVGDTTWDGGSLITTVAEPTFDAAFKRHGLKNAPKTGSK